MHDDDIAPGVLVTVRPDRYTRGTRWRMRYESEPGTVTDVSRDSGGRVTAIMVRMERTGVDVRFARVHRGSIFRDQIPGHMFPYPRRAILGAHPTPVDDDDFPF